MIHLKEFATQAEYEAFVESGEMKKPNVSLVNEPFGVFYNKFKKLGVFIHHINGTLYTQDGWVAAGFGSEKANGVAVVEENASFVIAAKNISTKQVWSTTSEIVPGVEMRSSGDFSGTDLKGFENTQAIVAVYTDGAAVVCSNYIFPNGNKGYLPGIGELRIANEKREEIDQLLGLIGGQTFGSSSMVDYFWSSTQTTDPSKAACTSMSQKFGIGNYNKSKQTSYQCRPFARLDL